MAFFTDMKRSLTETGKQVAQKTKELSDTVQLKTQLSREKEALNRQYAQIGKKVFEAANGADEEINECQTKDKRPDYTVSYPSSFTITLLSAGKPIKIINFASINQ